MTLRWKQEHVVRYWKVMGSKNDEKNVGTDEGRGMMRKCWMRAEWHVRDKGQMRNEDC